MPNMYLSMTDIITHTCFFEPAERNILARQQIYYMNDPPAILVVIGSIITIE